MSRQPDKSGNHSPLQPTPAQERIEETLRTLQETLRCLQESGSILDRSPPSSRHRYLSSRGYRTLLRQDQLRARLEARCLPLVPLSDPLMIFLNARMRHMEKRLTRFNVVCLVIVFHRSTDIYRYREHECVRQVKADAL